MLNFYFFTISSHRFSTRMPACRVGAGVYANAASNHQFLLPTVNFYGAVEPIFW
jgi:hypothetical protein